MNVPLSQELVDNLLADMPFVSRAHYFASIPSTNDVLMRMAADGTPEGTLVIADEQTAGRGRLDRRWLAPPATSLLFSVLFRGAAGAKHLPLHYTMICSLAVRDAVRGLVGLEIGLKWPNDLVLQGRKLGGILTEIGDVAGRVRYAVIGIGVNVNWDPSIAEFDQPATSLMNQAGRLVARGELLRAIAGRIAERYAALQAGESPAKEWEAALDTIGQAVVVDLPCERLEGMAIGVDADGALRVRALDGRTHRVVAGDVRVRTVQNRQNG